jgi:hypothetical protein
MQSQGVNLEISVLFVFTFLDLCSTKEEENATEKMTKQKIMDDLHLSSIQYTTVNGKELLTSISSCIHSSVCQFHFNIYHDVITIEFVIEKW